MSEASSSTQDAALMSSTSLKDVADWSSYLNLELFSRAEFSFEVYLLRVL